MVSVLTRRMRPTRLALAVAMLASPLVLAGSVSASADARAVPAKPAASQVKVVKNPAKYCKGIKYKQVKGERPAYAPGKLRTYGARNATCRAYWAAGANSDFVPQAVAVEGGTAWVSGYTAPVSSNLCRIQRMDLATGAIIAQQNQIGTFGSDGKPFYCRHGGGLTVDQYGMWISASGELWLLNRFAIGYDPNNVVLRHWRVDTKSNVSGSLNTTSGGYIMLAAYSGNPASSNVSWVNQAALMAPGVDRITNTPTLPSDLRPELQQPVPTGSQGLNWYQGLVTSQCGGVTFANGKRVGAIPGIEDIEIVPETKKAYIISESSARSLYGGGAVVPFLSEVSLKKLKNLKGTRGC